MTITKEVIGVCVIAARKATMPSTRIAASCSPGSSRARSAPRPAPTASAGAKMPPGIFDAKTSQITASFISVKAAGKAALPSSAALDSA